MKRILLLLIIININSISAQEEIQLPDCMSPKQSGVDQKALMKGIKGKLDLPKELFNEKVAVILKYSADANIQYVIDYNNEASFNNKNTLDFRKMISPVTEWIEDSGLNVHSFIFTETDLDASNQHFYNRMDEKKDLENFKNNGVKYLVIVSMGDDKSMYDYSKPKSDRVEITIISETKTVYDYSKETSGSFNVQIRGLSESKMELLSTNLYDLANDENASSKNYVEAKLEDRVSPNTSYKNLKAEPSSFKDKEIYFVLKPNLILPKAKPKGFMCKAITAAYQNQQKENSEYNGMCKRHIKDSGLNITYVNKKSDIPKEEDVYILEHYVDYKEFIKPDDMSPNFSQKIDRPDFFYYYLINNSTKDIFLFNNGAFSREHLLIDILNQIKN